MLEVAQSEEKKNSNIVPSAQYNIGRAYFMVRMMNWGGGGGWRLDYCPLVQGFGVPQSDSEAEKWWSKAASHGDDTSSVRASHTLGLYYSRQESRSLPLVSYARKYSPSP